MGVPVAGPMDAVSHRLANLLVGNQPDCATLEVTLAGPTLEFLADTTFAVAGAEFELRLDGEPTSANAPRHAGRGSRLRFGRRGAGARAYLAVAGGIDVPPVLGSRSTESRERTGWCRRAPALRRRPAEGGAAGGSACSPRAAGCPRSTLPRGGATVRVMLGPDEGSVRSARHPGVRAGSVHPGNGVESDGVPTAWAVARAGPDRAALLSSATPAGTVQVPPSGQPILLMADRQTTGGYATIATVISADLPVAGQLAPGDWIAFEACESQGSGRGADRSRAGPDELMRSLRDGEEVRRQKSADLRRKDTEATRTRLRQDVRRPCPRSGRADGADHVSHRRRGRLDARDQRPGRPGRRRYR